MKAVFDIDSVGRVTLSYDDAMTGERIVREFSCPPDGGYVIEFAKDGNTSQVCDRLAGMGSTLMAANRAALASKIRAEYRAMRSAERREAAKDY